MKKGLVSKTTAIVILSAVISGCVGVGLYQTIMPKEAIAGGIFNERNMPKFNDYKVKGNKGIARVPDVANYRRGELKEMPKFDETSGQMWQVDLRSSDLSKLKLVDREKDLMYADFDSKTKWPSDLPKDFNIKTIMENGKNPGLNLKKLHEKGITGKNVGIAIIDQTLLTTHDEYKDRLKFYEELHNCDEGSASMHGPAVSSIAVGKSVGVAPGADLYYIANTFGTFDNDKFNYDFGYLAQAIDRILEVNKTLPKEEKIRVISISVGWNKDQKGFKEVDEAVKRAKAEGILVVSTCFREYYSTNFCGLGRESIKNPDDYRSYEPAMFLKKLFFENNKNFDPTKNIMVPMDSRCTASPTGNSDYVFYREGGFSWAVPYVAGLYALSCQANPNITPEEFLKLSNETGDIVKISNNRQEYDLGKIINPERLIDKLK